MGSRTWIVHGEGQRWVAKAVTQHLAGPFAKGLRVARMVERGGIPAGAPVATCSGDFTVDSADGWRMALLAWVAGMPLAGADEREQRLMGTTLARVHLALQGKTISATPMIEAYRAAGPLTDVQLAEGLPVLLRFRWAVQADYFAWRISENDLTGISGPEVNEKGLEDARRALLGDGG